jgi:CRISPR type IV-associated protein Csf2
MKIQVNAILTTVTPLHIATPGAYRLNTETGFVEHQNANNKSSMTPCTAIQRLKIANSNMPLPVITSNNIAGRMRRHVATLVLNAAKAAGKKVSLQAYSSLMCGAVGGAPDKRDLTYAEYKKSASHPYIGLMGGGPRMLPRKMRVLNALPICEAAQALMGSLMHPSANDHLQEPNRLTQAWTFRHNDDLRELVNVPLQESSIENYEQEIQARQAAILAETSKGERSTTSTFAFSSFEFVIPGAKFNMVFELD